MKIIPEDIKAKWSEFAAERADSDDNYTTLEDIMDEVIGDGEDWEFQPDDKDVYDIYDLFVSDPSFEVETEGHDSFYINRVEA